MAIAARGRRRAARAVAWNFMVLVFGNFLLFVRKDINEGKGCSCWEGTWREFLYPAQFCLEITPDQIHFQE
jgi:hypothetical protein